MHTSPSQTLIGWKYGSSMETNGGRVGMGSEELFPPMGKTTNPSDQSAVVCC